MIKAMIVLLLFVCVTGVSCANVQCRDMNNKPVDWWYIYKLPKISDQCKSCPFVKDGLAFLYMDVSNPTFVRSEKSVRDPNQAIAYTLSQMYADADMKDAFQLLYNDQMPNGKTSSYRGHAKGVQYFKADTGFWYIHSVPRFVAEDEYDYPDSGQNNGQSMLCISFNSDQLPEISNQTQYIEPIIYKSSLSSSMSQRYPGLATVIGGKAKGATDPTTRKATLTSMGGTKFVHYAKNKRFGQDLYADYLVEELAANLHVETWLNGNGDYESKCDGDQQVNNLRSVSPAGLNFLNSKDHSKFAVSTDAKTPWVCIGDINRQKSQESRAGGTMCQWNPRVWCNYRTAADQAEYCQLPSLQPSGEENIKPVGGNVTCSIKP